MRIEADRYAVVKRGVDARVHRGLCLRLHSSPASQTLLVFRTSLRITDEILLPALDNPSECGITGQRGWTHPRLDGRALPRAVHDADRHAGFLVDIAREIVPNGREVAHGRARHCFPAG